MAVLLCLCEILAALSNPTQTAAAARGIAPMPCKAVRGKEVSVFVCIREPACAHLATCLYSKRDLEQLRHPAHRYSGGSFESMMMMIA